MGTKHNDSCLTKAADDEPIFVLRAQDKSAPEVLFYWLRCNRQLPEEKVLEVVHLAQKMQAWPKRKEAD